MIPFTSNNNSWMGQKNIYLYTYGEMRVPSEIVYRHTYTSVAFFGYKWQKTILIFQDFLLLAATAAVRVFHEWLLWLFRYLRVMRLSGGNVWIVWEIQNGKGVEKFMVLVRKENFSFSAFSYSFSESFLMMFGDRIFLVNCKRGLFLIL